ncbi:hypothetical protein [Gorillibacterium sp. CAU 1737]|uniref:siroheme decarboxylase subunit beta n=1 Tax=Gorillibacterium sp. CAU 1737 TaxID=3140362 RepID=UPI003261039B
MNEAAQKETLDEVDFALLRLAQDFPLCPDPYGELARQAGCSRTEALLRLRRMAEFGALRRIGAVLQHRRSGYVAGGMFVCQLPPHRVAEAGQWLAELPEVSHCYERKTYPDWPYNLYGMIHGRTEAQVLATAASFLEKWGPDVLAHALLFSREEWKKTSFRL